MLTPDSEGTATQGISTVTSLPLRIIVADDTPAMATFLEELINDQLDMEMVVVARDTPDVVDLARIHHPDVILLDIRMPGGGGVAAATAIRAEDQLVRIVALSTRSDQATIEAMFAAGADAYVVKGPDVQEILGAIRSSTSLSTATTENAT